jgi:hypothetical protein
LIVIKQQNLDELVRLLQIEGFETEEVSLKGTENDECFRAIDITRFGHPCLDGNRAVQSDQTKLLANIINEWQEKDSLRRRGG